MAGMVSNAHTHTHTRAPHANATMRPSDGGDTMAGVAGEMSAGGQAGGME